LICRCRIRWQEIPFGSSRPPDSPRLNDITVGDVLELDSIHELGSREYTLRGVPHLPPDVVKITATVVEHTKGQMELIPQRASTLRGSTSRPSVCRYGGCNEGIW